MIQALGFMDVSAFTANYLLRHKKRLIETDYGGLLPLRDADADGKIVALDVVKEWLSAQGLLSRIKNESAAFLDGHKGLLQKAVIEVLNPDCVTPWSQEDDDYAKSVFRLRICMIPSPGAFSYSGGVVAQLAVGMVNHINHRVPNCETNFGTNACARTHLIVDVRRLDADE